MEDDDPPLDNASVLMIAMGSAAFVVMLYHLITFCLCRQNHREQNSPQTPRRQNFVDGTPSSTECSVAHLIPAHKYQKRMDVASDRDETCAVCLGEFEEGEELKTLPECMHSFHVSCIDMWLYSHLSCPICRADATPWPAILPRGVPPDFAGSSESSRRHGIGLLQSVVVQSRMV